MIPSFLVGFFFSFKVFKVQRRKKCCTPTPEEKIFVSVRVFSMLASTALLAEGIGCLTLWPRV